MKLNKPIVLLLIFLALNVSLRAQNADFSGTYADQQMSTYLRLKKVSDEYHGVVQNINGFYAVKLSKKEAQIEGRLYANNDVVTFNVSEIIGGLSITFQGTSVPVYKISNDHQLEGMDLDAYFIEEKIENKDKGNLLKPVTTNKPNGNPKLYNLIAGGQLVFYNRGSYVTNSTASSLTYMNFCANGTFNMRSEGSYSVEGNSGGNVHGANRNRDYGRWEIIEQQGQTAVKITYANGEVSINPINEQRLRTGRWRIGNTQYAWQSGKAECY